MTRMIAALDKNSEVEQYAKQSHMPVEKLDSDLAIAQQQDPVHNQSAFKGAA